MLVAKDNSPCADTKPWNAMIASLIQSATDRSSCQSLRQWIERRNQEVQVSVERIPFSEMDGWTIAEDGSLHHCSGKFFSIEGIHVSTDYPAPRAWEQPIINQPEIGYLGILAKEFDGRLCFLMQAKIEPGNVNHVQISPTLQSTKSNYTRVHGGRKAAYLEYFKNARPSQIILDQLQSEQGARFLRKRNRNIIIKVKEEVPVLDDFRWMTLAQIKELMQTDNLVNMDTRTVISGLDFTEFTMTEELRGQMTPFGRAMMVSAEGETGLHTMHEIQSWFTNLKASYDLAVSRMPLDKVIGWECRETEIARPDGKYFRVLGVRVHIGNREVRSWCQPLVQPMQQGLCAFVLKEINGVVHFLVQAKLECGNLDVFELAPTVQCLTGNIFKDAAKPPFTDYVLNASGDQILYDTLQSEEGGRFYHEQNRNLLVLADDSFPVEVPGNFHWMTLGQINEFMRFNNYINIQARSLIAALRYA